MVKSQAKEAGPRGLFAHIWDARKGLRSSWERQLAMGVGEERLLFYVMFACFLGFIAGLPGAMRAAENLPEEMDFRMLIAGRFVAVLIFGALFLYGVAGLSHLIAKAGFAGEGSYFKARLALFWSLVIGMPMMLLQAAGAQALVLSGFGGAASWLGILVFGIWAWIWLSFMAFAEGFERNRVVMFAAAVGIVLAGISLVLA